MTKKLETEQDHIPSRRQNALDINRRIFPDKKLQRMSQYEIRRFSDHVYLTPTQDAEMLEYSFCAEYDNEMAGEFLLLMRDLHQLLAAQRQYRYPYGICDPKKIELLEACGNLFLPFCNRYGLFGLYKEMSIQNGILSLDSDGQPYLQEERLIPLVGTSRFRDFLFELNLEEFGLSDDFVYNLRHGLISEADYKRLYNPWMDSNESQTAEEFMESCSENVALILNSDIFVAAYYNTVLRDISTRKNHERHLEYQGEDTEAETAYVSRFEELRAEDLVIGNLMLADIYPSVDTYELLLPQIVDRLEKYSIFEELDENSEEEITDEYNFVGFDFPKFFHSLHYKDIDIAEFAKLCKMIEPLGDGSQYRLPNTYQVYTHTEFNGVTGKWEFLTEAVSLIGMIMNRRTLDLVYNNIETRICAKPGCKKSFTKHCYHTKLYCSTKCQVAAGVRRHRAKEKQNEMSR